MIVEDEATDGFGRDSHRDRRGGADHPDAALSRASGPFRASGSWRSAIAIARSARRVAREFDIPKVYGSWEDLVGDPEVDAVVIGAWPYLHCPVTLAAFDAGKHVLTQARMAMNAREAQRMLDRSLESPRLTAMIVPSPYGLAGDAYMRSLIAVGMYRQAPRGARPFAERPACRTPRRRWAGGR